MIDLVSRYFRVELAAARCAMKYSGESYQNQPRVPKGEPGAGRWESAGSRKSSPERKPRPNAVVDREAFNQFVDETDSTDSDQWVDFDELSGDSAGRLGMLIGEDLNGYRRVIDGAAIRHILKGHSSSADLGGDELAITREDIKSIPEIIAAADRVSVVTNARGMKCLRQQKRVNGHIFYLEEMRTQRRKLAVLTMWKVKSNKKESPPALPHTSETDLSLKQARAAAGDDTDHDRPPRSEVNKNSRSSPSLMRYSGERWITINGGASGDGEGTGTPIKIDDSGNIVGGPKGIADKGIRKLSDFGKGKESAGGKKSEKPDTEKPVTSSSGRQ